MGTFFSKYNSRIKKTAFFIPVTVYFFLFVVMAFIIQRLIHINEFAAGSAFADIFSLLLNVVFTFAVTILAISLIFVLTAWLYFFYRKKKNAISILVQMENTSQNEKQLVHVLISPIIRPVFGFIKIRLLYDKKRVSKKFSLLENNKNTLFSKTLEGHYHWDLPEIKEYRLEKAVIYFEDVFQFFSLATGLPLNSNFFSHPKEKGLDQQNISPRKTEETNTRIDKMRRVEGEFLNYKSFENNDDVRRIVWKIYAKNKELVVRIPETMDPYASHIYMYASFYSEFNIAGNETIEIPFLNYFKTLTWSVYISLVKEGFEVKYIPDQDVSKNNSADDQQWTKYAISTSHWQSNKDLKGFVQTKDAALVIISSLSDMNQVRELVERHHNEIKFIFIKLTESFKQQQVFDWVQWIFVENETQNLDFYKRKWAIYSLLKQKIIDNERKLEAILKMHLSVR